MTKKQIIKVKEYTAMIEYYNDDISMFEYDNIACAIINYNKHNYDVELIDWERTPINGTYKFVVGYPKPKNCPIKEFYYDRLRNEYFIIVPD